MNDLFFSIYWAEFVGFVKNFFVVISVMALIVSLGSYLGGFTISLELHGPDQDDLSNGRAFFILSAIALAISLLIPSAEAMRQII